MALDPYRRKSKIYRQAADGPVGRSRVPWVIGGVGLVAMLALIYQLGTMGLGSTTAQMFAWHVQSPP